MFAFGGGDTAGLLGWAKPGSDTIGDGKEFSAADVSAVVKMAASAKVNLQVRQKITSLGATAVKQTDLKAAMKKMSEEDQTKALKLFLEMPAYPESVFNFALAAMMYAMEAPPSVQQETTVTDCPAEYGYTPCSGPEFNGTFSDKRWKLKNEPYISGATFALKKEGMASNQLCCKNANAAGDPRPSCMKKVHKAQNMWSYIMLAVNIAIGLIPIPVAGLAKAFVAAETAAVATARGVEAAEAAAAGIAAAEAGGIPVMAASIGYSLMAGTMVDNVMMGVNAGIAAATDSKPMRDCCKDDFFKGDPENSIVLKSYTDENGKKGMGMWRTYNGCPVLFGTPDSTRYSEMLAEAIKAGGSGYEENGFEFPNADQGSKCTEGCMKVISMTQWMLGGRKKIGCYFKCPEDLGDRPRDTKRCSFICDTSGNKTMFGPERSV